MGEEGDAAGAKEMVYCRDAMDLVLFRLYSTALMVMGTRCDGVW